MRSLQAAPSVRDLAALILRFQPWERLTAAAALQHRFFAASNAKAGDEGKSCGGQCTVQALGSSPCGGAEEAQPAAKIAGRGSGGGCGDSGGSGSSGPGAPRRKSRSGAAVALLEMEHIGGKGSATCAMLRRLLAAEADHPDSMLPAAQRPPSSMTMTTVGVWRAASGQPTQQEQRRPSGVVAAGSWSQ